MKLLHLGHPELVKAIHDATQELLANEFAKNPHFLDYTNAKRAQFGLPPLTMSGRVRDEDTPNDPPARPTGEPNKPPPDPEQGR